MEKQNILNQLKPNHLPDQISIWPIAYGWWIVLALTLILLCIITILCVCYYKKTQYRRRALTIAKHISEQYQQHHDIKTFTSDCNKLLKQVVLSVFPRSEVANLYGQAWIDFLKNHCSECEYTDKAIGILGESQYKPVVDDKITYLYPFICHWIKKHHV